MGERAHTPGPWSLRRRDGVAHGDSDNLGWDWDGPEENIPPEPMRGLVIKEADARLIMAAPDMFEALLTALPYIECAEEDDAYKPGVVAKVTAQIRASLAKAGLGQRADATSSHPCTEHDRPSSPQESGR
jgi:hypothetical protein